MRHNKRLNVQSNPDIASTADELKANYAREAVIPPEANRDKSHRTGHAPVIGGLVLTALITIGGVLGYKMNGDSPQPSDRGNVAEAPANIDNEVSIENVKGKATKEQVDFVINNPVNIADHPSAPEQIAALGERWTVMINSGDVDWKNSSGVRGVPLVYTPETEQDLELMIDSIFEPTNQEYYSEVVSSIRETKDQHLAMFEINPTDEAWRTWVAVGDPIPAEDAPDTSIVNINTLHGSNQPDDFSDDGEYNDDYNMDVTLHTDPVTGDVKIVSVNNVTDIGNIGE